MEDPSASQAVRVVALSIAPDTVAASLTADSLNVPYGTPSHVIGKFTRADKSPLVGVPVHLMTQVNGGVWTQVDGVTDSNGTYEVTLQLTQSTNIQMSTDLTYERLKGETPIIAINVNRILTWRIPASIKAGIPYPVTAQVIPAIGGVTVSLSNGATALTDVTGKATFTISNNVSGFTPYRLSIASDQNFAAVQTPFVIVWVR